MSAFSRMENGPRLRGETRNQFVAKFSSPAPFRCLARVAKAVRPIPATVFFFLASTSGCQVSNTSEGAEGNRESREDRKNRSRPCAIHDLSPFSEIAAKSSPFASSRRQNFECFR